MHSSHNLLHSVKHPTLVSVPDTLIQSIMQTMTVYTELDKSSHLNPAIDFSARPSPSHCEMDVSFLKLLCKAFPAAAVFFPLVR